MLILEFGIEGWYWNSVDSLLSSLPSCTTLRKKCLDVIADADEPWKPAQFL